ncbi:MAG: FAD-binding oxidoreductase [Candidatus Aminicenantales bacterium]
MKSRKGQCAKIDASLLNEIESIVGRKNVVVDPERMADYSHDEFSLVEIRHFPEVVVKPESTAQVSSLLRLAAERLIPVTPRGGATGLCGGSVPIAGGIVLSLEKMNRVIEIDKNNQMAVVEAGVRLADFYAAVEQEGLFFPPHPGEESAMIGGLISTNAGGARAVKYGVMRNYVRGLELVLPGGEVIFTGGKLLKTSTGYNLLNLIIGSEGTLAVITRAVISLVFPPPHTRSLIAAYDELERAIATVPLLSRSKILPMAVEFLSREVIGITEKHLKRKWPALPGNTYLLIIVDASSEEEMDRVSEQIGEVCLNSGALDIFVAETPQKQKNVLEIRSKIYEAIKSETVEILDIVVPREEIPAHVKRVQEVSEKYKLWLPTFGHAADGNVHTHIMKARLEKDTMVSLESSEWKEKVDKVREELYRDCKKRGGVISGEHGIGVVKKKFLAFSLDEKQVELMRGIKRVFDPQNILNPGKIFDF